MKPTEGIEKGNLYMNFCCFSVLVQLLQKFSIRAEGDSKTLLKVGW